MAYDNHRFCWHGVNSTDVAKTTPFYSQVLGWTAQQVPMGDEMATVFLSADGAARAHTSAPPTEGVPSHWSSYFRVEDVDASVATAVANGGTVLVPPTDIPPGRFSAVASPSGAVFMLFHEASDESVNAPEAEGGIHWVELHSTDIQADLTWLRATFGLTTDEMPMPDGPYWILKDGEAMVGGANAQKMPGAPSVWLPWIRLAEVDAAVSRAVELGGKPLMPLFDVPGVGRMTIISDPTGGVVGVIAPPAA